MAQANVRFADWVDSFFKEMDSLNEAEYESMQNFIGEVMYVADRLFCKNRISYKFHTSNSITAFAEIVPMFKGKETLTTYLKELITKLSAGSIEAIEMLYDELAEFLDLLDEAA